MQVKIRGSLGADWMVVQRQRIKHKELVLTSLAEYLAWDSISFFIVFLIRGGVVHVGRQLCFPFIS